MKSAFPFFRCLLLGAALTVLGCNAEPPAGPESFGDAPQNGQGGLGGDGSEGGNGAGGSGQCVITGKSAGQSCAGGYDPAALTRSECGALEESYGTYRGRLGSDFTCRASWVPNE